MVNKQVTEESVERVEAQQAALTSYNIRAGRGLLYALPLVLVALTAIALVNMIEATILLVAFIVFLSLFAVNTLILGMLAGKTKAAFTKRLQLERQRGRPLDSLQGFVAIKSGVDRTISTIRGVFFLSLLVLFLYAGYIMLAWNQTEEELQGWIAIFGLGLSLVCFGASLLVRSIRMDITSVTGLSDFYTPSSHELLLENLFADVFRGHLDPIVRLKWDEFIETVRKCMKPQFVESVLKDEADESPVALAVEKLLYLHYMEHSVVLTHQKVIDELTEFLDLGSEYYHPDTGAKIGGRSYFNTEDIFRVFRLIEHSTPAFFDLIDRLQLELMDNLPIVAADPLYVDASAEEICKKDGECQFLLVLFNNTSETKDFTVRIAVSGLEPTDLRIKVSAEGRGAFTIPTEPVPLVSDSRLDVAHLLATIMKNSVSLWVTLEPKEIGTQTLQVFVEDSSGRVVEGKTMPVTVVRNIAYLLKRMTSGLSIAGGAVTPVLKPLIPGLG